MAGRWDARVAIASFRACPDSRAWRWLDESELVRCDGSGEGWRH